MNLADQLLAEGFVDGDERLEVVVSFLEEHEIEHVHELAGAWSTIIQLL